VPKATEFGPLGTALAKYLAGAIIAIAENIQVLACMGDNYRWAIVWVTAEYK
jgi:hypothetical protein